MTMRYRTLLVLLGCLALAAGALQSSAPSQRPADLRLPLTPESVRFAVIGDSGTGTAEQYQVAQEMEKFRQSVGFDFVLMLGDNIYGGKDANSFARKFEIPYKPLLDAGVKFYASLGNHDDPNERLYAPFNMGGKRYYSFHRGNVAFFALDSNYMDRAQLKWLEDQLQNSGAAWKICYFHHPLYSEARAHGSDLDLRAALQPLFEKYGVNLVFSGHDHVYQRLQAPDGIYYFVVGNSGQLRYHDLKRTHALAAGYDTDRDFLLVEIAGDRVYFQTVSRTGQTVDAGVLRRQ
ncbi:MAG TPA: metallophosphoesterase [Terriglobales bacterium]|nr:metallophosphoesterase [Terriglobales bacterium]